MWKNQKKNYYFFALNDTKDARKTAKTFFFVGKVAVKIHPISKGLATPTNLSTTGTHIPFDGCSLRDITRELSVETSTRKPSFFHGSVCSGKDRLVGVARPLDNRVYFHSL